ncbi:WhiB family transcriptional regulator [Kitasatospora sp. NPDC101183]|uniref:WhiB family transcriptional regulator n=1 Tax=Kitasatospora sp. NPDC101183 TaxID=3364100 RepID=UPI003808C396
MTVRIIRRSVRGTTVPNPAGRPARPFVEIVPQQDGDLHGAACTRPDVDPDWFFPDDEDEVGERRAKRICAGCPVREMCLALAIKRGEGHGIFGGLDATERRALTRQQRRAAGRDGRAA